MKYKSPQHQTLNKLHQQVSFIDAESYIKSFLLNWKPTFSHDEIAQSVQCVNKLTKPTFSHDEIAQSVQCVNKLTTVLA